MNTLTDFYTRSDDYFLDYDNQHGERLDKVIKYFNLDKLESQHLGDFGCGYGFLFKRLNPNNKMVGFDSGYVNKDKLLCNFTFEEEDLSEADLKCGDKYKNSFDSTFCLETIEHVTGPYNTILHLKNNTKINSHIYISIPEVNVQHTVLYPGLFYPKPNFEVFLRQMALEIEDEFFVSKSCHVWKCKNLTWDKKVMLFPKNESQFINMHPLEMITS